MDHSAHTSAVDDGRALTRLAISATLHCLTGCAIGEVLGMVIGTALGWSALQTIALAVALAFLFGYALTIGPILRSGLALAAAVPIAFAADTVSITVMEIVDNAVMLLVPGAMDAGLTSLLFWGALAFAFAVAFVVTVPVNRWLMAHRPREGPRRRPPVPRRRAARGAPRRRRHGGRRPGRAGRPRPPLTRPARASRTNLPRPGTQLPPAEGDWRSPGARPRRRDGCLTACFDH